MVIFMARYSSFVLAAFAFAALAPILASAPAVSSEWETPPGWAETRGGAGGKLIRVTSLAPHGPGSLGAALEVEGPRTVEFAVAGIIDLGGRSLKVRRPYLTIAGETAPNPGITIVNGGVDIVTHDVIVRHIRVRPTDGTSGTPSSLEVDALATSTGAYDVIIDHCSFAWGTDEVLSASGARFNGATPDEWRKNVSHRVTFNQCIIAEGTDDVSSKGSAINDNVTDLLIIGNLYISNNDRNPLFKHGVRAAMVNNLIHNPGMRAIQFGHVPAQLGDREPQRAALSMVGNVVRKGPSSAADLVFFEIWPAYGPCDLYFHDNLFLDAAGKSLPVAVGYRDNTRPRDDIPPGGPVKPAAGFHYLISPFAPTDEMREVATPPLSPPRVKARPAAETTAWVLANVGARPWDRDATDRRLIEEARIGGGKVIQFSATTAASPVK